MKRNAAGTGSGAAAALLCATLIAAVPGPAPAAARPSPERAGTCSAAPRRVELEATGRAPGASGWMDLRFGASPFGVAVTGDGSYRYRVSVHVTSAPRQDGRTLVAWAATPELDRHARLGVVGEDGVVEGRVSWNKFLVFVTAESSAGVERWEGPVLMTGASPSSKMHTMAGHGIFAQHGIGC